MVVLDSTGCSHVPRRLRGIVVSSDYIPLASRVKGACRCPVCSSNPEIAKWYENDILCKFDSLPCYSANYSGIRACSSVFRGHVLHCSRFVVSGVLVRGGKTESRHRAPVTILREVSE